MENILKEKLCGKCNKLLPIDRFYTHKARKDGYQSDCKICQKTSYPVTFQCTECKNSFQIGHRNIKNRKTKICSKCLNAYRTKKWQEGSFYKTYKHRTFSQKGYLYLQDETVLHHYKLAHRKTMEEHLGRSLVKSEIVHHIDGNRLNNDIKNLYLTNGKGHSKAHRTLQLISYSLVEKGIIQFDDTVGEYKLILPE